MHGEWRDIKGFEGRYCVNRQGEVWNNRTSRTLRPNTDGVTINLYDPERSSQAHRIDQLVAEHFPPRTPLPAASPSQQTKAGRDLAERLRHAIELAGSSANVDVVESGEW